MPLPTYLVELQFGASGWIDVSQYVQSVTLNKGITRVLEDYSAGSISVTFVNNARVFDPLNTSSPLWYGAGGYTIVQPGGKIRVSANSIRRFTGFIQDWDFSYDSAGLDGQATVTALDEMYKLSTVVFTGGTAGAVQATSDRMNTVFANNGFTAAEYAGIQGGQTLIGFDTYGSGESVLTYLQQVARSEPGDFYSNASAVMVFKDRSFTNYQWVNNSRSNYIEYPGTAVTADSGQWVLIGSKTVATTSQFNPNAPLYRGGTINAALPADQYVGFEFIDKNYGRYSNAGTAYVFSVYLRGVAGLYSGFIELLDFQGASLGTASAFPTVTSTATTDWVRMSGTVSWSGAGTQIGGVHFAAGAYGSTAYNVVADGWLIEAGTVLGSYFDGSYNPGTDSATSRNRVAWAGTAYASQSGYLSATASAITAPTILTFADNNSQGASYGNGTGIPFIDLQVVYGSENLYNRVQVVTPNATATVDDTTGQTNYGLRVYSQTDNLTTATDRPAQIAASLLAEWRLPEYRAEAITMELAALTSTQVNQILAVELRDVIRLCFQPSATGTIVDKYYQVLGVSENADVERDRITFTLGSLDNMPIRLDSTILAVLNTDTLG